MELISRKELRDKMFHEAFETDSDMQKWESGCWIRYKLFEEILNEMPIIESRPQGVWIDYTDSRLDIDDWYRKDGVSIFCKCSNCGNLEMRATRVNYNFCTNCGADMRGEE